MKTKNLKEDFGIQTKTYKNRFFSCFFGKNMYNMFSIRGDNMDFKDLDVKKAIIFSTIFVVIVALIFNISHVFSFIGTVIEIITPIIMGIVLAFLFNILMVKYEKLLFKKDIKKGVQIKGLKRALSIFLTILTVLLILTLVVVLLIPELFNSIKLLIDNIGNYTEELRNFGKEMATQNELFANAYSEFMSSWISISEKLGNWFIEISPSLFSGVVGVFGSIFNFVLGIVFAIYLLYQKEKTLLNLKKTLYAFVKKTHADKICEVAKTTLKTFTNFVGGQLTEAIILGTLCTLGMLALGMPYAVLIGVVVGITSLIPMFGAYLGAIPSAFLLLMEDPILAVIFIVFLIILQQFEGNVIYPKVVGASVGLTGFWILLAVVIGGAIGGVMGILIGVPLCSVIYYLLRDEVNKRLKKKKLKIS